MNGTGSPIRALALVPTRESIIFPPSRRRVEVAEKGYEWSNYRGATNSPRNETRELIPNIPLRKSFGDGTHALALGIGNLN